MVRYFEITFVQVDSILIRLLFSVESLASQRKHCRHDSGRILGKFGTLLKKLVWSWESEAG